MTHIAPKDSLGLYSAEVEDMMEAGVTFEDLEEGIKATDLAEEEKSALWLLAWSLETPAVQRQRPRTTLRLLGTESRLAAGGAGANG